MTLQSRVNPTPRPRNGKSRVNPTPLTHVLDFEFEPERVICGYCQNPIPDGVTFRTIAPSKIRYHVGCLPSRLRYYG